MSSWFQRLYPDTSFTPSHIKGLIQKAEKEFDSFTGAAPALDSFLRDTFSLHFINNELNKIRIDWTNIFNAAGFVPQSSQCTLNLTNAIVVSLENFRIQQHLKPCFVEQWMTTLKNEMQCNRVCCDIVFKHVQKVMKQYKLLSKAKHRQPNKLSDFLKDSFQEDALCLSRDKVPSPNSASIEIGEQQPQTPEHSKELQSLKKQRQIQEDKNCKLEDRIELLECTLKSANKTVKDQTLEISSLTVEKELTDMSLCKAAKKEADLVSEVKKLKAEQSTLKRSKLYKKHRRAQKTHQQDLLMKGALQQQLDASTRQMNGLKKEKHSLQKVNHHLKQEVRKWKEKVKQNQHLETAVQHYTIPDLKLETKTKQGNNQFTNDIRKTMIQLQGEAGVAASKCKEVVQIVSKQLFDQTLTDKELPCVQTIINMADEGHVISKLQVAEMTLHADNATLHTDGTSRDHNKLVGQQISLPSGCSLSLGFVQVESENASTLLDITTGVLDELSAVYCWKDEDKEKDAVFSELLKSITSLMSDRAAVMKSFNSKLLDYKQAQLGEEHGSTHFLYCNAHYLLGLSRASETVLKTEEKTITAETGGLGRDALPKFNHFKSACETATSRVIRTACDIFGPRGDEKNGCRAEWQGFCEINGRKSTVPCYRSNRFNCYFEGAASLIHHRQDMMGFFSKGSASHSNLKMQSVDADLKDDKLAALLCAVALLYFRVTGPYWNLLQSKVPYTSFHTYVQKMMEHFTRWEQDSSDLLNRDFEGIFGGEFEVKSIMFDSSIQLAHDMESTVKGCLQSMMKEIREVTNRQLADFQVDGKYGSEPTDDMKALLQHCPLTNLIGENAFGDFDFDLGKRRHCSLHHRTTTHMLKRNRTSTWLDKKPKAESAAIMKMAKKKGRILRERHRQQEKVVRLKIRERIVENERQKKLKELKAAEQKQKIIEAVMVHGGPCHTTRDVNRLLRSVNTTGRAVSMLKDEIRYQKLVLCKPGELRLTGSKDVLAESLKRHLGGDEQEESQEPEEDTDIQERGKRKRSDDSDSSSSDDSDSSSSDSESDSEINEEPTESFCFNRQGQWVSVFYDDNFYIGQVVVVKSQDVAVVKFLQQTKGRIDYFRWPACEDIAEVNHRFVFQWDFEVDIMSNDGRIWCVPQVRHVQRAYQRIKLQ